MAPSTTAQLSSSHPLSSQEPTPQAPATPVQVTQDLAADHHSSGVCNLRRGEVADQAVDGERAGDRGNQQFRPRSKKLNLSDAGEALAAVRYTFGDLPQESLVVVGLCAGTTSGHIRMDLAACQESPAATAEQIATWLAGEDAQPLPDAAMTLIFTGVPAHSRSRLPGAQLIATCEDIFEKDFGLPVVQSWLVADGYIRDYRCVDPRCCPFPGLDADHEVKSAMGRWPELGAKAEENSPQAFIAGFLSDNNVTYGPPRELIAAEAAEFAVGDDVEALLCLWEEAVKETAISPIHRWGRQPRRLAQLLVSLEDSDVAQSLIPLAAIGHQIANDGYRAMVHLDQEMPEADAETRLQTADYRRYCSALVAGTDDPPQWKRIEAFDQLLRLLVCYSGGVGRANILGLKAWSSWAKGYGRVSAGFLQQAQSVGQTSGFLTLMETLLTRSGPAQWARVKRQSYSWWKSGG